MQTPGPSGGNNSTPLRAEGYPWFVACLPVGGLFVVCLSNQTGLGRKDSKNSWVELHY